MVARFESPVGDADGRSVWIARWGALTGERRILLVRACTEEEAARSARSHWPDLGPPARVIAAGEALSRSVLAGRGRRFRVAVIDAGP